MRLTSNCSGAGFQRIAASGYLGGVALTKDRYRISDHRVKAQNFRNVGTVNHLTCGTCAVDRAFVFSLAYIGCLTAIAAPARSIS